MYRLDLNKKGKPINRVKIKGYKGKGMPEKVTARSCGISPDDKTIIVGMKDGSV